MPSSSREPGVITPRYLTACVRELLAGTDALVLTEAITNYQVVAEHLRASLARVADRVRRRFPGLGRRRRRRG